MSNPSENESKAAEMPVTQGSTTENESKMNSALSTFATKAKLGLSSLQDRLKRNNSENNDSRLSMTGLLKQARISFERWVETNNPQNYPMPNGIVFLTSIKGSFGWGGEIGTGIVLYRLPNKNNNNDGDEKKDENENQDIRWSGPCAIGSGGVSFGLQIGISKIDHIIMLPRKHHVKTFTSKGQLKLGGSSELTVINVGGKAQGSINIGTKDLSDIHSYSLDTKGLSIGVNVEGAVIAIRGDCNDSFYGKTVTVEEIACGDVEIPEKHSQNEDYIKIISLLNKYFTIYKRGPHGGPHGPPPPMGPLCGVPPHPPHEAPFGHHHPHPHPPPHRPQAHIPRAPHAPHEAQLLDNENDNESNNLNEFNGKVVPPSEPEPQPDAQIQNDLKNLNGNSNLNNNKNDENEFEIVDKVDDNDSNNDDDMELDDSEMDQVEGKITSVKNSDNPTNDQQ